MEYLDEMPRRYINDWERRHVATNNSMGAGSCFNLFGKGLVECSQSLEIVYLWTELFLIGGVIIWAVGLRKKIE